MKKNLLILLMIAITGISYSQTKVETEKKTIKVEKVDLKSAKTQNTKSVKNSNNISGEENKISSNENINVIEEENFDKISNQDFQKNEINSNIAEKSKEEQIIYYESLITAINRKVEKVKNDFEENKIAIETDWYQQMERNLISAKNKLSLLK